MGTWIGYIVNNIFKIKHFFKKVASRSSSYDEVDVQNCSNPDLFLLPRDVRLIVAAEARAPTCRIRLVEKGCELEERGACPPRLHSS